MQNQLAVTAGQYSDRGRKPLNQDFHGLMTPREPFLTAKGIAVAIADGISSSDVSQIASETSVKGFLEDYYATSESWSVKNSALRVLNATNAWLYAQTRAGQYRYNIERGYVCTFSALVLKATSAHIFHAGDARIYRLAGSGLEQLTEDHRIWLSPEQSYLSRALGMRDRLDIDYRALDVEAGDIFVLATDGIYEFADPAFIAAAVEANTDDLDRAARLIAEQAMANNSDDNLTVQVIRIDQVASGGAEEVQQRAATLPFPPPLHPRMAFDGYRILREVHHSPRSHIYLALDGDSGEQVILKTPSVDRRDDRNYLESFLMEEWVARRVDNAHLLKPCSPTRRRNFLYIVTEYIQGQTLSQWMRDNPRPALEVVRGIVEQIARGLQALHRQEMLHRDLRPDNIMIDRNGTVKIIDFGAVRVAGIAEQGDSAHQNHIVGTMQYTAPEYFLGAAGSNGSDLYSLGVIAYQLLSGRLPYGANMARASSAAGQQKLAYQSVLDDRRTIPAWIDGTLRKAVHPNPARRYGELSEFTYELRHPNPAYLRRQQPPLLEREPIRFWQGVSLALAITLLAVLATHPYLAG